jgi:hypothetical protein
MQAIMTKCITLFAVMVVSSHPGQGNAFCKASTGGTEKAAPVQQQAPAAHSPAHSDTLFTLLLNI